MDIFDDYIKHIRPFESLVNSKGYTGKFELEAGRSVVSRHHGTLKECLQQFMKNIASKSQTSAEFTLKTYAEFLSPDNYKECRFSGLFSKDKGFHIDKLQIVSKHPDESQRLAFRNNQEVPGKNAVLGRFRKPKPWDDIARGEFKHKKRW